ncbi:hypothetical protein MBLNU459_g1500t1 [Dothideomycetes sp. NU459]
MVGAVGEDSFGTDFIAALQKDHIDTSHIEKIEGQKTGIANIIVEEDSGENRILLAPNANHAIGRANRDLVPDDVDVVVFQLEIPLDLVAHNIKLAHSQGKYVILNPAPAQKLPDDLYQYIDCLIMNESEADILREATTPFHESGLPDICSTFFARGVPDMVIVTLGSKGVYFSARSHATGERRAVGHVRACKVKVVDTTAAGDTFVGGLAVRIAQNGGKTPESPREMVEFANAAAARTVEKAGAMAAIPWLDEVEV